MPEDLLLTARMVTVTIGMRPGRVPRSRRMPLKSWDAWLAPELSAETFDDARAFSKQVADWLGVPLLVRLLYGALARSVPIPSD